MKISVLNNKNSLKVAPILAQYGFNDYRAYRILEKGSLAKYLLADFLDSVHRKGSLILAAQENGRILGLVAMTPLPWDTRHFGLKAGKLDYFMAGAGHSQALRIKEKLLEVLFKFCGDNNVAFLSCRADAGDITTVHALEKSGMLLMDTIVTYAFNRHKHRIPELKGIYKVSAAKSSDSPGLADIAGSAFSKDRFHLDVHIPHKKADGVFREWIKNSLKEGSSQRVFVARKWSQPCGFLTFTLNRKLESCCKGRIAGHGLSAVSPEAKGAYIALVKAAIEETARNYDCLEFDTQLSNQEVIKVWQRFGFDFIRAKHTFHKWL